jgi:transposase
MIHLTTHTQILLAIAPADFRMGIDGLAARCRGTLAADPRSGVLFVFINRSKAMIRTLAYDGSGFWLMTKRLSRGKLKGWPGSKDALYPLGACHLRQLLTGALTILNGKNAINLHPLKRSKLSLDIHAEN